MKPIKLLPLILASLPLASQAQVLKPEYIDWGTRGTEFPAALEGWSKGDKWSDDDNFFISRVKPKERFRNQATQVNPLLSEENDKKLIFWVPINNETTNALPDGVYDSEVFPMWSYVTHYGNWSTTLVRMPGNFADVAHKNGVPVSVVASVPYGNISEAWLNALTKLTDVGAEKVADFMSYYGVDGLGYNSEFAGASALMPRINTFHASLIKEMKKRGMALAENIWYDGTNESGTISFDRGLGTHNDDIWGYGDNIRTSLFFNYNWNTKSLLNSSVKQAESVGRSPLDLYCGINMQGKEPHNSSPTIWPLLRDYNLSIGLWGAHSQNMFFEIRGEKGSDAYARQRAYMKRIETWFTGGTRNPANTPEISNSLIIAADNAEFFGMSKFMSARSALKWDLTDEPFISHFNLGNGRFFNWQGRRCHDSEWYNIGIQDYLPTWMWWFAQSYVGTDVAKVGLDAEFVWDDAWTGGSLVRIHGNSDGEYLHLFKTDFALKSGDVVTLRYKIVSGRADANLVFSAVGSEKTPVEVNVMGKSTSFPGGWIEKKFIIGQDFAALSGKELAMVALHFESAARLDMRLGEFSIVRAGKVSAKPATPVIEKAQLLASRHNGADAKVIFNMPNDKAPAVCYNLDVATSMFKLYAQPEGGEPILMGATTSWAGLLFSIPVDINTASRLRIGVAALSLDMTTESDVAWSDWMELDEVYAVSDHFAVNRPSLRPNEAFTIAYDDPRHESADWTLISPSGKEIGKATGTLALEMDKGVSETGNYTLRLSGTEQSGNERVKFTRDYAGFLQVNSDDYGMAPELTGFKADDPDKTYKIAENVPVTFSGATPDAVISRGVKVGDAGIGFKYSDTGMAQASSFSVSFWIRIEDFDNTSVHLFSIRDKEDKWPVNNWGWFYHTLNSDGTSGTFCIKKANGSATYDFGEFRLIPGTWHHLTYVFDFNARGAVCPSLWLDGKKAKMTGYNVSGEQKEGEYTGYINGTYGWREKNVVAIGGYCHKSGSVRGNVDHITVWNKAVDAADVAKSMTDIAAADIPDALLGYFDFESSTNRHGVFTSTGKKPFSAGPLDYKWTEVEGQGTHYWVEPEYCAGAPATKGAIFTEQSVPVVTADNCWVSDIQSNGLSGTMNLHFGAKGEYPVSLRLVNSHGESEEKSIRVKVGSEIDNIATPEATEGVRVARNPFDDCLEVTAIEGGDYRLTLHDMSGHCILSNDFDTTAGSAMRVYPQAPSGLYLLNVVLPSGSRQTFKVIKR